MFTVASPGVGAAGTFEPVKVVLGAVHSCALDSAKRVQCWGGTKYHSGLPDADRPRTVRLGRPAVDIAAGANHTCAVLDDKSVKCWGDNRRKQFGITTKLTKSPVPKTVAGLRGAASAIAAGADRPCVRGAGGRNRRFHRGQHREVLGLEHVPTVRGIRIKDREVAGEDRLRRLSEAP